MDGVVRIAIALGSNLGDRRGHLAWAVQHLAPWLADLRQSSVIETDPVDVPAPQPPYLNAVVTGLTDLEPDEVLGRLLALERARGRRRIVPRGPRLLDLDLIFYGDRVLERGDLIVPHPRFRVRRFVLEPLAELAPDWRDPVTGTSVAELLAALDREADGEPRT